MPSLRSPEILLNPGPPVCLPDLGWVVPLVVSQQVFPHLEHNITTYKEGNNTVEIDGKVLISELSGSESLIHFTNGNLNWVSLSNGIQQKNIGENTKLFMNIDEFLYFDENNRLVNHG